MTDDGTVKPKPPAHDPMEEISRIMNSTLETVFAELLAPKGTQPSAPAPAIVSAPSPLDAARDDLLEAIAEGVIRLLKVQGHWALDVDGALNAFCKTRGKA